MAANGRVISLGKILWKIARRPIIRDLSDEHAAELALECLELLGAPMAYKSEPVFIDITEHRGKLPDDLLYIEGVRAKHDGLCDPEFISMREASDIFHFTKSCRGPLSEFTYKVQGNYIFPSFEEGGIEMVYKTVQLDEDGFPLIPDNPQVKLAVQYYVMAEYLSGLHDIGKITDKTFGKYEQKKLYYMAAANSSLNIPSVDKMETIMNGLNRIIQRVSWHNDGFRNFGTRELLKK